MEGNKIAQEKSVNNLSYEKGKSVNNLSYEKGRIYEQDIINKLSAPFPAEAIQRTTKEQSKKGYDTTGIACQYIINRFNDVLGLSWGFHYEILKEQEGEFSQSKLPYHEIVMKMTIWIIDTDVPRYSRSGIGGHTAINYADALKGAISNALKKTASLFGNGRQGYEGSLDEDTSYPASQEQESKKPKQKDSKALPKIHWDAWGLLKKYCKDDRKEMEKVLISITSGFMKKGQDSMYSLSEKEAQGVHDELQSLIDAQAMDERMEKEKITQAIKGSE